MDRAERTAAAIIIVLILLSAAPQAEAAGQFSQTCMNIALEGTCLKADCLMPNGGTVPAKIYLSDFIGLLMGRLTWGGSGFQRFCRDLALIPKPEGGKTSTWLRAYCETERYRGTTEINLDERIGNNNGVLTFQ
ncbi:MAG: CVNH domain-containing protein [Syntrophales bacterium]|nr:CVNH domain-containing protein [Syntrophales bacterium]MDD5233493.1 CVNH domain-containing protein [Syntrophales bacterium]MDD5533860.1 CVNH domain-containing protein [Syntrophales bacterium]